MRSKEAFIDANLLVVLDVNVLISILISRWDKHVPRLVFYLPGSELNLSINTPSYYNLPPPIPPTKFRRSNPTISPQSKNIIPR